MLWLLRREREKKVKVWERERRMLECVEEKERDGKGWRKEFVLSSLNLMNLLQISSICSFSSNLQDIWIYREMEDPNIFKD